MKEMIRACIQGDLRKWEAIIPLLFSIREAPQASMWCTSSELDYRHKPRGLIDVICEELLEGLPGRERYPQFVQDFQEGLERVQLVA